MIQRYKSLDDSRAEMNPGDRRRAPEGKFRVVGYDQYDYTDYVVGDFATPQEAGQVVA